MFTVIYYLPLLFLTNSLQQDLPAIIFPLQRQKSFWFFFAVRSTGLYIWHSPRWRISLRLTLEVFCDIICFPESFYNTHYRYPWDHIPRSAEYHHINSCLLRFPPCLLTFHLYFHFSLLHLINVNLAPVISWELSICHKCIMGPIFRYASEIFCCERNLWSCGKKGINNCCQYDIFLCIFFLSAYTEL